jgi:hypothetical protein
MPDGRISPNWDKLQAIADRAVVESQQPGWTVERFYQLWDEAVVATNANYEFTEFMVKYAPKDWDPDQRRAGTEPDWGELEAIARRAQEESQTPGWNLDKWNALCDEAEAATNGHGQFTEFMAHYKPPRAERRARRIR